MIGFGVGAAIGIAQQLGGFIASAVKKKKDAREAEAARLKGIATKGVQATEGVQGAAAGAQVATAGAESIASTQPVGVVPGVAAGLAQLPTGVAPAPGQAPAPAAAPVAGLPAPLPEAAPAAAPAAPAAAPAQPLAPTNNPLLQKSRRDFALKFAMRNGGL